MEIRKETAYIIELGILEHQRKEKIEITLNWWGRLLKWLRGNRATEGVIHCDIEKDKWYYELPPNIKPSHIKQVKLKE